MRLAVSCPFGRRCIMSKEEKFIMAGGTAVRVSDTVRGDHAVLLLHGYLESLDVWDDFTELLAPHVRVVALDLPGHGVSEIKGEEHTMEFLADTAYAAMNALGVGRAVVAGHSMGGYVALEMLRKYPEVMDGLVLLHSTPYADDEKKRDDRLREVNLILGGKKEFIARNFPHVGFAPQNRAAMADAIAGLSEQISMTEDAGIVAVLRGIRDRKDLSDVMREAKVPEMMVFGRYDHYVSPDVGAALAAAQPQAQTVWLENSGHMGFMEEPQATADALLGFVRRVCGEQ